MPKRVTDDEKRVSLNCLVSPETMEWLRAFDGSQGSGVDYAVLTVRMAESQGRIMPAKKSKKAAHVEALRASDPLGSQRDDIEHGNMELPSGGSVGVVGAAVPASHAASGSISDWRAGRKPLMKPSAMKEKR